MIRRPKISREEIVADVLYLLVAMTVSALAIYIFDIHWSFYPGERIFPPSRHVFTEPAPYYVGIPVGTVIGFIMLKLVFFAFMEEGLAHKNEGKGRELMIKLKKGRAYMGKE